jgi:hypothetical protein
MMNGSAASGTLIDLSPMNPNGILTGLTEEANATNASRALPKIWLAG